MIVGMTSLGHDFDRQLYMGVGLDDCYGKPLSRDVVDSLHQQLIDNN